MMVISLDNLAYRYGILPSEALARGTTLDLYVMDVGAKWSHKQHEEANGTKRFGADLKPPPKLTEQEMFDMINRVKAQEANRDASKDNRT